MNITYISDVDISQPNGPGVNEREFVWTLQTESALRGDTAFFLIPKPARGLDFKLENVTYYHHHPKVEKGSYGAAFALKIILTTWHLSRLIVRRLRISQVDLFVIRLNPNCAFVPILLLVLGQRYALKTLGNIYGFERKDFTVIEKLYFSILRKYLRVILRKAAFIDVCTSQYWRRYRDIYSLKHIKVIENSVNTNRFYMMDKEVCKKQCGLSRFDKIVGYCGGHPSLRGARQLIEISPDLVARYANCGIVIIGEDAELSSLKARAKELGTDNHIVFTGVVDYEFLNPYLNCLDVGVALDTGDRVKFVGNASQKVRQYLACGIPVIVPKGTNEQITSHGLGHAVSSDDLTDICNAICFWFDRSVKEREEFSMNAHGFTKGTFSTRITYMKRYTAWQNAVGKRVE